MIDVPFQQVRCPVKIGDIVTFSYEVHSRRMLPVNMQIYRVRKDINWEEVVRNFVRENLHNSLNGIRAVSVFVINSLIAPSGQVIGFKSKPKGHWVLKKRKNMRAFFENYARSQDLDPLIAKNWYYLAKNRNIWTV